MTFIVLSKPSLALSKLGHQLICQLAFEHLPNKQQAKLIQLLDDIPQNHQDLINHYNYKKPGSAITFANACTWADAVKRVEEFKDYNAWHYMNVPRNLANIKINSCLDDCLPQAILQHQSRLKQSNNKTRWQALLFLSHWLGDIHQPLHISFASELGGNKVKLAHLETKCSNLHWYWDQCILYQGKHSKAKWRQSLTAKWHESSIPSWQENQVWQWADESFQIVKQPSFHYCQLNKQGVCLQPSSKITLPQGYLVQHQPVMAQRLLLAAQRLTQVLNASL